MCLKLIFLATQVLNLQNGSVIPFECELGRVNRGWVDCLVVEIAIDYGRCTGCKKCVEACAFGVLEFFEEQPVVANSSNCSGCLNCSSSCPVTAITVKEK